MEVNSIFLNEEWSLKEENPLIKYLLRSIVQLLFLLRNLIIRLRMEELPILIAYLLKVGENIDSKIMIFTSYPIGKMIWWNTQQVSAIKVPSRLISEKKRYNAILKDSSSIEAQKNLFPRTAKNKSKGRSKRNSNVMTHNSRNPSVGDGRYSSSVITVQKANIKSKLFKYKQKFKRCGITEVHSNKSNSSIRNSWTPLYMMRQNQESRMEKSREKLSTQENFKKTINGYYENMKKRKSKNKKKNSKKSKQGYFGWTTQ